LTVQITMMSETEKAARALLRPPATRRVALDLIEADLAAPGNGRHNLGSAQLEPGDVLMVTRLDRLARGKTAIRSCPPP